MFNLKITLKDYQQKVVQYMLRHRFVVNASDMGTGKTIEAITAHQQVGGRAFIVCPAYLRENWADEYRTWCINVPDIKVLKTAKQIKECRDYEVAIISYSGLQHAAHLYARAKVVAVDECQAIKNSDSQRTTIFTNLIKSKPPSYLFLLSGTPIKNRVTEFYSALKLTSYNPFGVGGAFFGFSSYYSFAGHFAHSTRINVNGFEVTKYFGMKKETLPELKRLLVGKYIRVRAEDVLKDLPEITEKEIFVDVKDGKLLQQWKDLESSELHNSTQKSQSAAIKAPKTAEYVNDLIATGECAVVFTDHLDSQALIARKIKGRVGIINGGVTPDKRHFLVKEFQEGRLDCLVLTIGAGGTGFTLTRSRHLIFNDQSWVPGDNKQAWKRIHRIGQKRGVIIHYIIGGHIDKLISRSIREKEKVLKDVLED